MKLYPKPAERAFVLSCRGKNIVCFYTGLSLRGPQLSIHPEQARRFLSWDAADRVRAALGWDRLIEINEIELAAEAWDHRAPNGFRRQSITGTPIARTSTLNWAWKPQREEARP
jgi:hypothetical protein